MTCRAFAGDHGCVFALDIFTVLISVDSVARVAEKSLFCHNHPRDVACVSVMTFETPAILEKLVVGAVLSQFHQITMAVDAQSRVINRDWEQFFLIGAVGSMTGIASTLAYRLVDICLGKLYLSIHMAGITSSVHPAFEHTRNIRSVGIVTGDASPLGKRLMQL